MRNYCLHCQAPPTTVDLGGYDQLPHAQARCAFVAELHELSYNVNIVNKRRCVKTFVMRSWLLRELRLHGPTVGLQTVHGCTIMYLQVPSWQNLPAVKDLRAYETPRSQAGALKLGRSMSPHSSHMREVKPFDARTIFVDRRCEYVYCSWAVLLCCCPCI